VFRNEDWLDIIITIIWKAAHTSIQERKKERKKYAESAWRKHQPFFLLLKILFIYIPVLLQWTTRACLDRDDRFMEILFVQDLYPTSEGRLKMMHNDKHYGRV